MTRLTISIIAIILLATACTPAQVGRWLDLHGIATTDAQNHDLADRIEAPDGWVDLGHGSWGPAILVDIRRCESGNDYSAQNPVSSARGAWQVLRSRWASYVHEAR